MNRLWLLLALCGGGPALAGEVLLVPDVQAAEAAYVTQAAAMQVALLDALEASGLTVIREEHTLPVLGELLPACPPGEDVACAQEALTSLPARVAMVVGVEGIDGQPYVTATLVQRGVAAPVREMAQPLPEGEERRYALQLALFGLGIFDELGASPASMVQAAERMTVARPAQGAFFEEDLEEDITDEEAAAWALELEREPVVAPRAPRAPEVGRSTEEAAALTRAQAERAAQRSHARRGFVELRAGVGFGGVDRSLVALGVQDPANPGGFTQALWLDAPTFGSHARFSTVLGYAPAAAVDVGLMAEVQLGQQRVRLGYMSEVDPPVLGDEASRLVPTVGLLPRVRLMPVTKGLAKPYLLLTGGVSFVSSYEVEPVGGEPYPEPPGGVRGDAGGGLGLVLDPLADVGLVIEVAYLHQLGGLGGSRVGGAGIGPQATAPTAAPYRLWVDIGVQVRF